MTRFEPPVHLERRAQRTAGPLPAGERGISVVEVLLALVVLSVGILAVGRLFPTAARTQVQDRLLTSANYYAQERLEELITLGWSDANLTAGRHPAGTATETLENGQWQRFYVVTDMSAPLDNLKKLDVTVNYQGAGLRGRSVTMTTYVRR
jgi:Tfp pilus assembly protein PilV